MPKRAIDPELADRFFEELSATLDLDKTIQKLGISPDEAKAIFKSLVREKPVAHPHPPSGAFELFVDGASRGNPGEAGAGALIKDGSGKVIKKLKKYLGTATNNTAEYSAMIMGLQALKDLGAEKIKVFADSELMVKQINGHYKVRSEDLRPLYEKAIALLKGFKGYSVAHVYREKNSEADKLANEAIDGHHQKKTLFD